jgi:hypothetical protein
MLHVIAIKYRTLAHIAEAGIWRPYGKAKAKDAVKVKPMRARYTQYCAYQKKIRDEANTCWN